MPQLPNPTQSKMSNSAKKLNKIIRIESVIRINKSKYINDEQYDVITQICSDALNEEKINNNEIAIYCTEKIKKKLKTCYPLHFSNLIRIYQILKLNFLLCLLLIQSNFLLN